MSYAILRTAKLKSFGEIGGSLSHNYRTRKTPNADENRTFLNSHSIENADLVMQKINEKLPVKRRKDAVLCVEYLITMSPKFKGDADAYFQDSIEWLKSKHGNENLIATSIHRDETTPHLVAYVVPIKDGKLNAKHFLGGRQKLSEMQTDFHKQVGEKYGLERGIEGSKARHKTIKQYYAGVNNAMPKGNVEIDYPTEKSQFESIEDFAERVATSVLEKVQPQIERVEILENELQLTESKLDAREFQLERLLSDTADYRQATEKMRQRQGFGSKDLERFNAVMCENAKVLDDRYEQRIQKLKAEREQQAVKPNFEQSKQGQQAQRDTVTINDKQTNTVTTDNKPATPATTRCPTFRP